MPVPIEKNIPIPRQNGPWKYDWYNMEVGDSFLVTDVDSNAARSAAWSASRMGTMRFITRKVPRGTRIYRVA